MKIRFVALFTLFISVLFILGCSMGKQVSRINVEETVDLSGRWNDTDSRLVSEAMIQDCLNHQWLRNHITEQSEKPVVIIGPIRNKSLEHIPTDTFVNDIERAFINSGQVKVVADAMERLEIRSEREDQSEFASAETRKRMREELGADYMMTGVINSIEDQEEGEKIVFYQTDLTLIDIETNTKVWIGSKKIKKYISRSRYEP